MTSPELRRSRVAILGYFFILGVGFAAWAARLPAIKQSLHLSDGRLGLALFAVPAGSVLTLALSGRIADRFGAVRVLRVAGVLFAAALVLPGLAGNLAWLMVTLAVFGALSGLLDVSMNACGARLELGYGRPIMSSLHAGYSIAGLGGAAIGGVSAWLGASPLVTFAVTAAALIVGGLLAGPHVFIPAVTPREEHPGDPAPSTRNIQRVIWVLGLLALCGQVGEGSAGDWSAVYLHVDLGTSAGAAAVALGAFSVTMAAGRVAGDRLAARFGPVRLVRASGLVAGLGLAGGLLVDSVPGLRPIWPAAAIAGFALLGLGLAGIFPQIVTAAARLDPEQAGRNIGRIAAVSYTGLLSGPVAIGAIASGVGLRNALLVPAALAILVAAAAGVMKPARAGRARTRALPRGIGPYLVTIIQVMTTISLADAKARLSAVLDEVRDTHERVVITRNGRPEAVIMSVSDLEALEETLDLLSTPGALDEIRAAEAEIARGETTGADELRRLMQQRIRAEQGGE